MKLFSFGKKKERLAHRPRPHLSTDSPFAIKEAYNSIRTKLIFTGKGEKCPIFAVTSALASDGKTTNSVSLAISFAMAEQRVLLIDADMRKPSLHRYFKQECRSGLSEILAGLTKEINIRTTEYAHLSFLSAGQIPPNPAELLGSKQLDTLLEYARQHFDYVIVDTPPINVVTDASVIAEKVTGFVIVAHVGKNHLRDLKEAAQRLQAVDGSVVGIILNDPGNRADTHYSYHYNHYYRYDRYKYKYYGEDNTDK